MRAIRDAAVVVPFVGVEVFDGRIRRVVRGIRPAYRSRNDREAADIALAGLSDPAADRSLHEMFGSSIRSSAMPNVSSS